MLHGNETLPFCIQQNFLVMWSHFQALRTGVVGCGVAQGLEGRETAADKTAKKMALVSWSIAFTTETDLKMPLFNFERTSDEQVHPSGRVIHKGVNPDIDSYSAFFDNAKLGKTNLEELIRKEVVFFFPQRISFHSFSLSKGCTDAYVCGIATDVCVGRSLKQKKRLEMSLSPKLENALNLE